MTDSFMFKQNMDLDQNLMLEETEKQDSPNDESTDKSHGKLVSGFGHTNESFINKLEPDITHDSNKDKHIEQEQIRNPEIPKPKEPQAQNHEQDPPLLCTQSFTDSFVMDTDSFVMEEPLLTTQISNQEKKAIIQKKITKNESEIKGLLTESQIMFKE